MSDQQKTPAAFRLPNTAYDVVAMAASAGGLEALIRILSPLPSEFPAAILVLLHLDPNRHSLLASILSRRTQLSVCQATEGATLRAGSVYVAPPDRHLLVEPDGTLSLTRTSRVHFVRPSANPLFESIAASFGARALAVVLTGTGSDGAEGVKAVKDAGGIVIVQDAASCAHCGMPEAAIQTGAVDYIVPLDQIAATLETLVAPGD